MTLNGEEDGVDRSCKKHHQYLVLEDEERGVERMVEIERRD